MFESDERSISWVRMQLRPNGIVQALIRELLFSAQLLNSRVPIHQLIRALEQLFKTREKNVLINFINYIIGFSVI